SILPRMTRKEAFEVSEIYSIAGLLPSDQPLIKQRPFRAVHHTASNISIVGGGKNPSPGEISLAHRGVLFLDEIAEFPSAVLEVLRQPLEDRKITVSRASGSFEFPAHFSLVAAMNPCPCGYYQVPNSDKDCTCSTQQISRYKKKLSGPLMDRIDLYTDVSPVKFDELSAKEKSESSEKILERVQKARNIQTARFKNAELEISSNAEMSVEDVKKFCPLPKDAENLLRTAMKQFCLSARAYHRIIKVSRSIADLAGEENICITHIAEALQYRKKGDD
ncbi:TPA: ATP-binding protein, partial [Candidatus Peregrinibacteria bacterium]|nr:ATP-binding protein [Candidatus Peregrinibacteria bacterium]